MKVNLYVMRDVVADLSGPVFEAINHRVACRKVRQLYKADPETGKDMQLMHIGYLDHATDFLIPCEPGFVPDVDAVRDADPDADVSLDELRQRRLFEESEDEE